LIFFLKSYISHFFTGEIGYFRIYV
jgi:hypothetical protein